MRSLELHALGSRVFAAVDSDDPGADALLGQVPEWLSELERVASRFLAESELNELNASPARQVTVSRRLGLELEAALAAARWTDGLVTPCALSSLEAHGYDRSFELLGDEPSGEPKRAAVPSFSEVSLDLERRRVERRPGLRLDLSGTAKARTADRIATRLGELAPALVDAGGDIAVSGPRADGSPWPIGVSDPVRADSALHVLALESGGVATSGRDFRRWRTHAGWAHHIIDPRSGLPASTDVLTATVVGPSAARADVAAKVLVLLGSKAGLAWLECQPELEALLVLESGERVESPGFPSKVWS